MAVRGALHPHCTFSANFDVPGGSVKDQDEALGVCFGKRCAQHSALLYKEMHQRKMAFGTFSGWLDRNSQNLLI
jgi:hypothetical protein